MAPFVVFVTFVVWDYKKVRPTCVVCRTSFVISMIQDKGIESIRHGRSTVIRSRETVSQLGSPCLTRSSPNSCQVAGDRIS
jgi:hypothetical protein